MNFSRLNRWIHHWATLIVALPVMIMIGTGIILLLKKDVDWVQPPSAKGIGKIPTISFEQVLTAAQSIPEAQITGWGDIDRLDVRPAKGMLKIRAENRWEIQIDSETAEVLQVAFRRSDLIESIHDGSFFHDKMKLFVFLPAAIVLALMWLTGLYLFALPHVAKARKKKKKRVKAAGRSAPQSPALPQSEGSRTP